MGIAAFSAPAYHKDQCAPTGTDYTYYSVFIYNFLKHIEWQSYALTRSELVIGVVESTEATAALQKWLLTNRQEA